MVVREPSPLGEGGTAQAVTDEVYFAVVALPLQRMHCRRLGVPAGLYYSFSAAVELNLIRLPLRGSHLPLLGRLLSPRLQQGNQLQSIA